MLSKGMPLGFTHTSGMAGLSRTQTNGMRRMMAADFQGFNNLTGNPAHVPNVPPSKLLQRTRTADHASGPSTAPSVAARPSDGAPPPRPDASTRPRSAQPPASIDTTRQMHERARETMLEGAKLKTAQQKAEAGAPPARAAEALAPPSVVATTQRETSVLHIEGTHARIAQDFANGDIRASSVTKVPPNTRMILFYPQLQLKNNAHAVYMRTHIVDRDTGALQVGYALCFDESDTGAPVRYVGAFAAV